MDRIVLDVVAEARRMTRGHGPAVGRVEPAAVSGDPDRLRQLLLNLMDNAIRYTPPSGRVTIALRADGGWADITVRDSGVGIAADALPHVFERFCRGDRARARDPSGTGLGLPIARWVAEQHGGTLQQESGRGTIARVRLPLVDAPAVPAAG